MDDDRRRARRGLAWRAGVAVVALLAVWHTMVQGPSSAADPDSASATTSPSGWAVDPVTGGGELAGPTLDGSDLIQADAGSGQQPGGPVGGATAGQPGQPGQPGQSGGSTPAGSKPVGAGAGLVVPAAVTSQQQAQAVQHWTSDTTSTAQPAPAPPAPAPAPATGATTGAAAAKPATGTAAAASTKPTSTPTVTTKPAPAASAGNSGAAATSTAPSVPTPTAAPVSTPAATATSTPASPTAGAGAPVAVDNGSVWTGGGQVSRTSGRVFFTRGGVDYTCSATAVQSGDASTVITAAHCVWAADTGYATRWVFAPGWAKGAAPNGLFAATHFAVLSGFLAGDVSSDVAFVHVAPNASGQGLGEAVGGLPVAFGAAAPAVRAFGYPATSPWTGAALVACSGPTVRDTRGTDDLGLTCGMTAGSSGGAWLADLDAATGSGKIVSVTSFAYSDKPSVLFGPTLGSAAQALCAAVCDDPNS